MYKLETSIDTKIVSCGIIRVVYTRENKLRLTLAAAYVSRERNYLYEYILPGQDKTRLEKAVNVGFVPFIRVVRGLRKPRLIFSRINGPIVSSAKVKKSVVSLMYDFCRMAISCKK